MKKAPLTALVTGSSSGLGLAVAEELKKRSFRVIGLGRKKPENVPDEDFIRLAEENSIVRVVRGEQIGTTVKNQF